MREDAQYFFKITSTPRVRAGLLSRSRFSSSITSSTLRKEFTLLLFSLATMLYSAGSILCVARHASCVTGNRVVRYCCLMIRCVIDVVYTGIPDSPAAGRCCCVHGQHAADTLAVLFAATRGRVVDGMFKIVYFLGALVFGNCVPKVSQRLVWASFGIGCGGNHFLAQMLNFGIC
jgi:hypothetical protein